MVMSQGNDKLDLSLSSGLISVQNEDEEMDLKPGNRIQNLSRKGSISEKVSPLPYRLTISPDRSKFNVPVPGRTTEIELTLQMIDVKTGRNVARTGEVYISVEIDKIVFPEVIKLNDRGYARLKAVVKPFQTADYREGQVEILAVMDGIEFIDVGSGMAVLTYDIPPQAAKTIRVDLKTGELQH